VVDNIFPHWMLPAYFSIIPKLSEVLLIIFFKNSKRFNEDIRKNLRVFLMKSSPYAVFIPELYFICFLFSSKKCRDSFFIMLLTILFGWFVIPSKVTKNIFVIDFSAFFQK